ncbi:MAG: methionyl-tRNA formyltransferase [Candidatus Omnitrophica bacterium]|nr:methionyl-tRNA formyltransferase [Candidatus Omnitrophota bacterium]
MRIIFWGSGDFALVSLKKLASKHQILAAIIPTDKKKGRGLKISIDPVKEFSQQRGFEIYQPKDFSADFINVLKRKKSQLFVVVNYGRKLSNEILGIPKIYSINLHPSLLPKYRGPAPINWALIQGEKKTGVSIIKIGEKIDAGEIIYQKKIGIKQGENAGELTERLAKEGANALLKAIELLESGQVELSVQNEQQATYFPKLDKSDGEIDWSKSAEQIYNLIRGFTPRPGAFTFWKEKRIKIWRTRLSQKEFPSTASGTILEVSKSNGILAATENGTLWIEELQREGKRRMTAGEFVIGHKIKKGENLCKLE